MAYVTQVAFDTADPHAQAAFWAELVGYEVEDHSALVDDLVARGALAPEERIQLDGRSAFRDVAAARDPEGKGPRFFFQKVPEGKTAKNRVHVDVGIPHEKMDAERDRAIALGARLLWTTSDRGPLTYTMADPEGNEFCLHG